MPLAGDDVQGGEARPASPYAPGGRGCAQRPGFSGSSALRIPGVAIHRGVAIIGLTQGSPELSSQFQGG